MAMKLIPKNMKACWQCRYSKDINSLNLKCYPVDMGFELPRPVEGTPRLASGELQRRLLID